MQLKEDEQQEIREELQEIQVKQNKISKCEQIKIKI